MAVDPAFKGVGKSAGLQIWRIEKMAVATIPPKTYGKFYDGDSYICLSTKEDPQSGALSWDVHFWLGSETSTDEKGVAAYKTVELDDSLGGAPVQHREVQDHESALFLSYFKSGIKYLKGGVASGFRHVEEEKNVKRLMRVKGKRNVRVREVPCKCESLNKGDCFILDCGDVIYQWNGPQSNRMERIKACNAAKRIRDDERKGKAKVKVIESTWEIDEDFFKALGDKGRIKEASEVKDDVEHEKLVAREVRLFRISDESGALKVHPIYAQPIEQKHLSSKDAFILDTGAASSGIFVWIGKECTKKEKSFAIINAEKFLTERKYPNWAKVCSVIEGGETATFKQYFKNWRDPLDQKGLGNTYKRERIAKNMPEIKIDVKDMHARNAGSAAGLMPDEGKGKVEIFRVENFDVKPVPKGQHGFFFGGDSYIVKYEATNPGRDIILYYWLGSKSSQDEKATAALTAKKMDDEMGGKPIQVRVTQGKEPEHFLRIFQGRLIVFMGGKASGFKNLKEHDTYDPKATRMFHVRGTNPINSRAVEVDAKSSSLNTNDVFVVDTPSAVHVWTGKGANDFEKKMGMNVAKLVCPDRPAKEVKEGSEPSDFFTALGGKAEYVTEEETGEKPYFPARMFLLTNAPGFLTVEEVENFTQEDLDPDDVMLLDTHDTIFIWVGEGANEQEKKEAENIAMEYVKTDPSPRNADDVCIITVKQGKELPYFTCHFMAWDKDFWKVYFHKSDAFLTVLDKTGLGESEAIALSDVFNDKS